MTWQSLVNYLNAIFGTFLFLKKNLAGRGMTAPVVLCDREDRLTPAKKIPKPLPHPYTAAP